MTMRKGKIYEIDTLLQWEGQEDIDDEAELI